MPSSEWLVDLRVRSKNLVAAVLRGDHAETARIGDSIRAMAELEMDAEPSVFPPRVIIVADAGVIGSSREAAEAVMDFLSEDGDRVLFIPPGVSIYREMDGEFVPFFVAR